MDNEDVLLERLRGLRLPGPSRRVLQRAAPPGAPLASMSVPCARWETVARLRRRGLIEVLRPDGGWGSANRIRLTPLGSAVRDVVSEKVRPGQPIRWPRVVGAVGARLREERA